MIFQQFSYYNSHKLCIIYIHYINVLSKLPIVYVQFFSPIPIFCFISNFIIFIISCHVFDLQKIVYSLTLTLYCRMYYFTFPIFRRSSAPWITYQWFSLPLKLQVYCLYWSSFSGLLSIRFHVIGVLLCCCMCLLIYSGVSIKKSMNISESGTVYEPFSTLLESKIYLNKCSFNDLENLKTNVPHVSFHRAP